jgi:hypothetical protein
MGADVRFFLPRGEAARHRTSDAVSLVYVTERPARTPGTPLRNLAPTAAELVARDIASLFMLPAVVLIVWWTIGSIR